MGVSLNEVEVTVTGAVPAKIEALTADGAVAVDESVTVKFKVTDALGNAVAGETVSFKLDKKPAGSAATIGDDDKTDDTDSKGEASTKFIPDKVGEYKVKATVQDAEGNDYPFSATVTLEAQPFGTVWNIRLYSGRRKRLGKDLRRKLRRA